MEYLMEHLSAKKRLFIRQAEICKTFANPTRIEILYNLRDGEKSVGELVLLTGISRTNISQQLAILRQKGVVETRREGTKIYYRVSNSKIIRACELMREALLEQLSENERLAREIEKVRGT